jgi:hypothetical protein
VLVKCSACGQEWPRDPALEVECPVCRAGVGVPCKRPSGHETFGSQPHPDRDRLAMHVVTGYGRCPAAVSTTVKAPDGWVQPALFAEPGSEDEPVLAATCFVCGRPVLVADAHRCHEKGCVDQTECSCDLLCHPRCCPMCAQARQERLRMAFDARGKELPPARSPHRELWEVPRLSGE